MRSARCVACCLALQVAAGLVLPPSRSTRSHHTLRASETSDNPDAALASDILAASSTASRLQLLPTFKAYADSAHFRSNIWQKRPFLVKEALPNIAGAFNMGDLKEIVDSEFLEAGRGTFQAGRGGWNMAAVSKPRGTSFQDAKLQFQDVLDALTEQAGTVVFNSAGGFMPKMAVVCLECLEAFQMPTALNMHGRYITAAGQKVSAPPHTDKQDVFVLQTQGRKHWRVFAPPPPARMPKADPFARGKGTDSFALSELDAPLIDTVLSPGQTLYVPAGFPHTTDTTEGIDDAAEESVHLTVGIDTHIWALNFAALREMCLRRGGVPDKLVITRVAPDTYWSLQSTLPYGFLLAADASANTVKTQLVGLMRRAEEARWKDESDDELSARLHMDECVRVLGMHHNQMTNLFRGMYSDVGYKISEAKVDISFLRSKPYFEALESTMSNLVQWSKSFPEESVDSPVSGKKSSRSKSSGSKKGFQ